MKSINTIYVKNVVALCALLDEFEEFEKKAIAVSKEPYFNKYTLYSFFCQVYDVSQGKLKYDPRGKYARDFYYSNKKIIDQINAFSNIYSFGEWCIRNIDTQSDARLLYDYISKHTDKICHILKLMKKMYSIGIIDFTFDDAIDFTDKIYTYKIGSNPKNITYIPNIEAVSLEDGTILYKSTDSNYELNLYVDNEEVSIGQFSMVLNSLLFDENTLPKVIDKKHTSDIIFNSMNLPKKNKQKSL